MFFNFPSPNSEIAVTLCHIILIKVIILSLPIYLYIQLPGIKCPNTDCKYKTITYNKNNPTAHTHIKRINTN